METCDPAIRHQVFISRTAIRSSKARCQQSVFVTASFTTAKTWKQPEHLPANAWMRMWCVPCAVGLIPLQEETSLGDHVGESRMQCPGEMRSP